MKFLVVLVALAAVAFAQLPTTSTWTLEELTAALQDPSTNPEYLPYLEEALDHYMDALFAGVDKPTITVTIPADPEHIDVWPIELPAEESDHIDVWPIAIPDEETPAAVAPVGSAASSPLVQIIVNVQKQQVAEQPSPVVVDDPKPDEPGFIDVFPIQLPAEESDHIDVWPIQIPAEDADHMDVWPIQIPAEDADHVDVWPVQIPSEESDHIDVWPVQIPGEVPEHIDVWPISIPDDETASAIAPTPSAPSSPLVQIIVNVQKQQEFDSIAADAVHVIEDPMAR